MPRDVWTALMQTYVRTVELRHSLVHRTVYADSAGALVGVDKAGTQIRPMLPEEQEAFGRVALRAAQVVLSTVADRRVTLDLTRQLGLLLSLHGVALPHVGPEEALPRLTVITDRVQQQPDRYLFDADVVRQRSPFEGLPQADLVVRMRDRPGQELHGRLEAAPHGPVLINPDLPPDWLF